MRNPFHTYLLRTLAIVALGIVSLTAMLWSCTRYPDYHPDHGIAECEITEPLNRMFSSMVKQNEPGMMVTIIKDDTVKYYHAFGRSRLDSMEFVSDSTIFNAPAASKLVTGVAMLMLVEDSVLKLDDKLSKYFPEFPAEVFDRITVRHILNHTSGLPDLRPTTPEEWQQYLGRHTSVFGLGRDYRLYATENELIKCFKDVDTLLYQPGTHFCPNDISYILVAPLVERATGMNFAKWMRKNIFDPADMQHTFYYIPGLRLPGMAHGYRRSEPGRPVQTFRSDDGKWDEYDYQETEFFVTQADKGLFTTARDFRKFRSAVWRGDLISHESIETFLEPTTETGVLDTSFAMTAFLDTAPDMPRKSFQTSENGGFSVILGWWPDHKVNYSIFMARNDLNRYEIIEAVDSIICSAGWLR